MTGGLIDILMQKFIERKEVLSPQVLSPQR